MTDEWWDDIDDTGDWWENDLSFTFLLLHFAISALFRSQRRDLCANILPATQDTLPACWVQSIPEERAILDCRNNVQYYARLSSEGYASAMRMRLDYRRVSKQRRETSGPSGNWDHLGMLLTGPLIRTTSHFSASLHAVASFRAPPANGNYGDICINLRTLANETIGLLSIASKRPSQHSSIVLNFVRYPPLFRARAFALRQTSTLGFVRMYKYLLFF